MSDELKVYGLMISVPLSFCLLFGLSGLFWPQGGLWIIGGCCAVVFYAIWDDSHSGAAGVPEMRESDLETRFPSSSEKKSLWLLDDDDPE